MNLKGESAHIVERGVLRGPRPGRGRLAGQPHHQGGHLRHEGEIPSTVRCIHILYFTELYVYVCMCVLYCIGPVDKEQ